MANYRIWKTTDDDDGKSYVTDIFIYNVKHCEAVEIIDSIKENEANELDRISLDYIFDKHYLQLDVALLSVEALAEVIDKIKQVVELINGRKKWTPCFH